MLHVEADVYQIIAHRRESNEGDVDFLYVLMQYEPNASIFFFLVRRFTFM
jgi:hypothetical protein